MGAFCGTIIHKPKQKGEFMKDIQVNFLETHYLFSDDSHTIDAFVRNRCEKELLQIISLSLKELNLGTDIKIESLPPKEGGLIEWLQLTNPSNAIALASLVSSIVMPIIIYLLSKPKETTQDKELKSKKLEDLELGIEKKRIEIKILKKKLISDGLSPIEKQEKLQNLIDLYYEQLTHNVTILRHISNFYQNLIDYEKVQSMEYTPYNQNHQSIMEPKTVYRKDFHKFILQTSEDEIIDENAKIYIHSPMLVEGKKHWSGYYTSEEQVINFAMSDKDFKNDVTNGTIKFANGSFIYARLRKTLKFDDFGNIKNML